MKLKDRVLEALEESRGSDLSGEVLAGALSVSRNAVWKAMRQLQNEGHEIKAVPNRGYQLVERSGMLSKQSIARHLGTLSVYPEVFAAVPSTNALLRQRAEEGALEGTLLVAERQTAGHGRFGRAFHSPPGGGIYMSLLLRPTFSAQDALSITTSAAVAVCRAIEKHCGVNAQIKWVNDVFCHGKKVCGIGTEAALDLESGGLHYVILGIGINLYPSGEPLPPELSEIVGTVLPQPPRSGELRSILIAEIVKNILAEYPQLCEKRFFEDYRARCFVLGKAVHIVRGERQELAQALDLAPDFSLRVRYSDGKEASLSSGEISIRPTECGEDSSFLPV